MNNWKSNIINLGSLKPNSTVYVKFESNIPLDIARVEPECLACTKFIDYKDNILTLSLKVSDPKHLSYTHLPLSKSATVYYNDGTSDTLKFVGVIKKQ